MNIFHGLSILSFSYYLKSNSLNLFDLFYCPCYEEAHYQIGRPVLATVLSLVASRYAFLFFVGSYIRFIFIVY